jgi:hypothetical protein
MGTHGLRLDLRILVLELPVLRSLNVNDTLDDGMVDVNPLWSEFAG